MTRFMMTLEDAVDLVLYACEHGRNGDIFVQKSPNLTGSTRDEGRGMNTAKTPSPRLFYRFTVSPAPPLIRPWSFLFIRTCSRFMVAEWIRYFISWRAYNINDLLANLVGVVAGCVVFPADFRR